MRFLAAFMVFVHHGAKRLPGDPVSMLTFQGALGVTFFFVLSGFVLTWSRRDAEALRPFYRRRFARIYPLHLVALGLFMLATWQPLQRAQPTGARLVLPLLLLQAWVPSMQGVANPVAWTLSCEMFFYAVFPFLIPRLAALRDDVLDRLALVLVAVPIVLAAAAHLIGPNNPRWTWLYYEFPVTRLAGFVLGMLVALAVERQRWPRISLRAAALLAAVAYIAAGLVPREFKFVALPLVPICVLIGTVAQHDAAGIPSRLLQSRWLVRLGAWSYAFYLIHLFVIESVLTVLSRRYVYDDTTAAFGLVVAFVITLAGAAVLHRLVEQPLERWLRGSDPNSAVVATGRATSR